MSDVRSRSLCCTCMHEVACIRVREIFSPVIHCELFENEQTEVPASTAVSRENSKVNTGNAVEEPDGLRGLCVNCHYRFDCCLPRPEGGVWHCEEYR